TTKVLGTAFSGVKKDPTEKALVSRREVNVGTLHTGVDLVEIQQAGVKRNTSIVEKRQGNAVSYSHWMAPTLEYSDIPLGELSNIIELRYGLPFRFQDEDLKDYRLKVTILKQDKIETVVSKLNFITNIKFKMEGHEIIVNANN